VHPFEAIIVLLVFALVVLRRRAHTESSGYQAGCRGDGDGAIKTYYWWLCWWFWFYINFFSPGS